MDKNNPKISIIMPVYNTAAYVDAAIKSVISQRFKDFELILINDGSTDGSLNILEKWALNDDRVKVFSQDNQGLSAARNAGIVQSNGKYVYFMDSDDLIALDIFDSCYSYCEKEQLDFTFFDADVFSDDVQDLNFVNSFHYKRQEFVHEVVMSGKEAFDYLLRCGEFFSSVCLLFINRNFLSKIALTFENRIIHEDELFTSIVFFEAKRVAYLRSSYFLRRVRMDSIMTSVYSMKNIQSYFIVGEKLLQYGRANKDVAALVDLYLKRMIDAAVWKAYQMSLRNRIKVFLLGLWYWRRYVKKKTFAVLLFKKYTISL